METMKCTASVWPHRHTNELTGPLDVRISYRNQPPMVRFRLMKYSIHASLEQPDERTNLTIIKLFFNPGLQSRKQVVATAFSRRDKSVKVYLRYRLTKKMEHPIPRGRWEGTCNYDDTQCVYTFQAMTMKVQPEESRIIVP